MTNNDPNGDTFGEMLSGPPQEIKKTRMRITWLRPDGSAWSDADNIYNMADPVDVGTLNRNIQDGYLITSFELLP